MLKEGKTMTEPQSIWLIQERLRERNNGEWSEWRTLFPWDGKFAHIEEPQNNLLIPGFSLYREWRLVEYVRKQEVQP